MAEYSINGHKTTEAEYRRFCETLKLDPQNLPPAIKDGNATIQDVRQIVGVHADPSDSVTVDDITSFAIKYGSKAKNQLLQQVRRYHIPLTGEFFINGREVNEAQFKRFCEALQLDPQALPVTFRDGNATAEDVLGALGGSSSRGHSFTTDDFIKFYKKYGAQAMRRLNSALDKYSYGHWAGFPQSPFQLPANDPLRKKSDYMLAWIAFDSSCFMAADPSLKADEGFIQSALLDSPGIVNVMSDETLRDPMVQSVIFRNNYQQAAYVIGVLGDQFTLTDDLFTALFAQRGFNIERFFDLITRHSRIGQPLAGDGPTRQDLQNRLFATRSQELLTKLALRTHRILPYLPPRKLAQIWPTLTKAWQKEGINFPDEWLGSYQDFLRGIASFTRHPDRFRTTKQLFTAWQNHLNPFDPRDKRPIALLIYNDADWNGAFESDFIADRFFGNARFRVLYYESNSEAVLNEALLKKITHNGKRPIHTTVFAGHGDGNSVQLGTPDPPYNPETAYIDTADIFSGELDYLSQYLDPHGQLLVWSCSAGKGGATNPKNFTNSLSSLFPPTFHIYSLQEPFSGSADMQSEYYSVSGVSFTLADDFRLQMQLGEMKGYHITGRRQINVKTN